MKRALLILFAYLALASVQIAHAIDIFLLGGQSNMVGQGTNNQSYTGNALLLTRANTIITLVDPSGDNSVSIYPVYTGNAFGSCVPAMATFLDAHVPTRFMFVHVSLDGCSITNMMPGTAWWTAATNRFAIASTNGTVKALLHNDGETDAHNGMTRAQETSNLWYFADAWFAATGTPVMASHVITINLALQGSVAQINAGIDDAVGQHHVIAGPFLDVLNANSADGLHVIDNAGLTTMGLMWGTNVVNYFYPPAPRYLYWHASIEIQRPDFGWAWNAATGEVTSYELQIATSLAQFFTPPMIGGQPSPEGIGSYEFAGETIWTTNTNYFVFRADAPIRLGRVRAWNDCGPGDWATATLNAQPSTQN